MKRIALPRLRGSLIVLLGLGWALPVVAQTPSVIRVGDRELLAPYNQSFYTVPPNNGFQAQIQAGDFGAQRAGGASRAFVKGVATDSDGNVYVGGYFHGNITIGGQTLAAGGESFSDAFLWKLNSSGVHQWVKHLSTNNPEEIHDIAVDGSGNVYAVGVFYQTLSFGDNVSLTASSNQDVFLWKLNSSGTTQWAKGVSGSVVSGQDDYDSGRSVAVDDSGNVYVFGDYRGIMRFAGSTITATGGGTQADWFVAKWNSDGVEQWARTAGGTGSDTAGGDNLAVDGLGNVYVASRFSGPINVGGSTIQSTIAEQAGGTVSASDYFVWKLNSSGAHQWVKEAGGKGSVGFSSPIAVDALGSVYLTGSFNGRLGFEGSTDSLDAVLGGDIFFATEDIFVWKLNSSGVHQWAKRTGDSDNDLPSGIAEMGGNVYVVGHFRGTAPFGSTSLTSDGTNATDQNAYIWKLGASDGSHISAKKGGGASDVRGDAVFADKGNVFIGGRFSARAATFDGVQLSHSGGTNTDIYVWQALADEKSASSARFVDAGSEASDPDGSTWATAYSDLSEAISTASSGDTIFVKGGGVFKPTSGVDANDGGLTKRDSTFKIGKKLAIYGGFLGTETGNTPKEILAARPTNFVRDTLSGDIGTAGSDTDNSYHVVTVTSGGANSVLNGFVIIGGNANGTSPADKGGGLHMSAGTLSHSIVTGNKASQGAGLYVAGAVTVSNSVIRSNTSTSEGAGIYQASGAMVVTNSTLYGNNAGTNGGGGLSVNGAGASVFNSIFYGNDGSSGSEEIKANTGLSNLTHSLIQGANKSRVSGVTGEVSSVFTNTSPFASTTAGDTNFLRLASGSAAIDAGDDTQTGGASRDLDGNARIQDGDGDNTSRVDIGAYEKAPPPAITDIRLSATSVAHGAVLDTKIAGLSVTTVSITTPNIVYSLTGDGADTLKIGGANNDSLLVKSATIDYGLSANGYIDAVTIKAYHDSDNNGTHDTGEPSLTRDVSISVTPPTITGISLSTTSVESAASVNDKIGDLTATGTLLPSDGHTGITFTIAEGNDAGYFKIGNDREVQVASALSPGQYDLKFKASYAGVSYTTATAIRITVIETAAITAINVTPSSLTVPHLALANTKIADLSVTTTGITTPSITYSIVPGISSPGSDTLKIANTNELQVSSDSIDYGVNNGYIDNVTIQATHTPQSGSSITKTRTIRVRVLPPSITGINIADLSSVTDASLADTKVGVLKASGLRLPLYGAETGPAGKRDAISFTITSGNTGTAFKVVTDSVLQIATSNPTAGDYSLGIRASYLGVSYTGTITVQVQRSAQITGITLSNSSVDHLSPLNTKIAGLRATHQGLGLKPTITYSITAADANSGSDTLKIGGTNNDSLLVKSATINYGLAGVDSNIDNITVTATHTPSGGGADVTRSETFTIKVNAPTITGISLSNTVPVNNTAAADTKVGDLSASGTLLPSDGSGITYSIESGNTGTVFKIANTDELQIASANPTAADYDLSIKASYLGIEYTKTISVTIGESSASATITAINLNSTSVAHLAAQNSVIATLTVATKGIASPDIHYSLSGDGSDTLKIGTGTDADKLQVKSATINYGLSTNGYIDDVTITAYHDTDDDNQYDAGEPTLTETVSIQVLPPAITGITLSTTSVTDNARSGTKVGDLTATGDYLGDGHTDITFTIEGGNSKGSTSNVFQIGNNRELQVATSDAPPVGDYDLSIKASYLGSEYTKTIRVSVQENPEITGITLSVTSIAHLTAVDTKIAELSATHRGLGQNPTITYSITGDGSDTLKIANTDELHVKSSTIDYGLSVNGYIDAITITATHTPSGGSSITATKTIRIQVLPPNLTGITLSNSTVADNAVANAVVGNLTAAGTYLPANGYTNIAFSITGGNSKGNRSNVFQIGGANSNQLQVAGSNPPAGIYNLSIRANYVGVTHDETIRVTVTTTKAISRISLTATSVPHLTAVDTKIADLSVATKGITTPNITYSISGNGADTLKIANTDELHVKSTTINYGLAGVDGNIDDVVITATHTNNDNTTVTKSQTFSISVTPPAITAISLAASAVTDNATEDQLVGTLTASGTHLPTNGYTGIAFSIVGGNSQGNTNNVFKIVGNQLQAAADYPPAGNYVLRIKASYVGVSYTSPASGASSIGLTVTSVPAIRDIVLAPSSPSLQHLTAADTKVGDLSATHKGIGNTPVITYTIKDYDAATDTFKIEGTELKTNKVIDYGVLGASTTVTVVATHRIALTNTDVTREEVLTITITPPTITGITLTQLESQLRKDAPIDYVVGTLTASGSRLPTNGYTGITFGFTSDGNPNNNFKVAGNELQVNADLSSTSSHTLKLTANYVGVSYSDDNTTTKTITMKDAPTVTITDIALSGGKYVLPAASQGTVVGRLSALGANIPPNDLGVTFSITSGNTRNVFTIVGKELRVQNTPGSTTLSYTLGITATFGSVTSSVVTHVIYLTAPKVFVDAASTYNQKASDVGTTWKKAYDSLHRAIENTGADSIFVKVGTYKPTFRSSPVGSREYDRRTGPRRKSFSPKTGQKIYGGFTDNSQVTLGQRPKNSYTTLSGDIGIQAGDLSKMADRSIGEGQVPHSLRDNSESVVRMGYENNRFRFVGVRDVVLDGFIIEGAFSTVANGYPGAISNWSTTENNHFENLIIRYNLNRHFIQGGAIQLLGGTLMNSIIHDNDARNCAGGALHVWGGTVSNNLIYNNTSRWGAGMVLSGGGDFDFTTPPQYGEYTVVGNTFYNNRARSGRSGGAGASLYLTSYQSPNAVIANNIFFGGEKDDHPNVDFRNERSEIWTDGGYVGKFANNLIRTRPYQDAIQGATISTTDCIFTGKNPFGSVTPGDNYEYKDGVFLALSQASRAIGRGSNTYVPADLTHDLAGNTRIQQGVVDMGAYETPYEKVPTSKIYVDSASVYNQKALDVGTTWEKAYSSLVDGIDNATSEDTLFVKQAKYKPTKGLDKTVSFSLGYGLRIYGGFPRNLTGTSTLDDRPAGSRSILSGDIGLPVLDIGGIDFSSDEPLPASFRDNSYHVLLVLGTGSGAVLDGFVIEGGYDTEIRPILHRSPFRGAGLHVRSDVVLRNLEIRYNVSDRTGGGVFLEKGTLKHSLIHDNKGHSAAGIDLSGGTVSNSLIYNNYTSKGFERRGGGVGLYSGSLVNSTVYGNVSDHIGGGVYIGSREGVLANTLIYGNHASADSKGHEVYNANAHTKSPTFVNNLVKGADRASAIRGVENHVLADKHSLFVEADPFASTSAGANFLHLSANSAAINSGDDSYVATGDLDLAGVARIRSGRVDIGAYESPYESEITSLTLSSDYVSVGAPPATLVGKFKGLGRGVGDGKTGFTFSITSGNVGNAFEIKGDSLRVKTTIPSTPTSYSLNINASYLTETRSEDFTIRVVTPTITNVALSGNSSVQDGSPAGTVVGTLSATGTYLPPDGAGITYSIVGGNTPETFEVDGNELKVKTPPDRSTKDSYDLQIRASYLSATSSPVTITISITRFISFTTIALSGNKQVISGAPAGTVVGNLSAAGTGLPSDGAGITYVITDGNTPETFEIEGDKLKVKTPPDYDTKSSYALNITATYSGVTSAKVPFTIQIARLGEITAIVANPDPVRVADGEGPDKAIAVLSATHVRLGSNPVITHSIKNFDATTDTFKVVGNQLKTNKTIDNAVLNGSYTLTLVASHALSDGRTLTRERSIVIGVSATGLLTGIGVNPDPVMVAIGLAADVEVANLSAFHSGLGANPDITYNIKNFDASTSPFKVVGNQLKTNRIIDSSLGTSYSFTIVANHLLLSIERGLTVQITQNGTVNSITSDPSPASVSNGTLADQTVATLAATSTGLGLNPAITYIIKNHNAATDTFKVVGNQLKTNKTIDDAVLNGSTSVTLVANYTLPDGNLLTHEQSLTILIRDAITFTSISLSGSEVRDGAAAGTVVGTLSSTGNGLPADGAGITYAIADGNTSETFEIEGAELRVKTPPDYSATSSYDLSITASYSGVSSSAESFTISVLAPLGAGSGFDLRVYPNPATGVFHLSGYSTGATYRLLNSNGTEVASGVLRSRLDIRHLPTGAYVLEVTSLGILRRQVLLKR